MDIHISIGPSYHRVDVSRPISLSRPLRFNTQESAAFGLPPAMAKPFEAGTFVGATEQGGSVNCRVLTIAPHGNGTHTETVHHIVDDLIPVAESARWPLVVAHVVTVPTRTLGESGESYPESDRGEDHVITAADLDSALAEAAGSGACALVIRTPAFPSKASYDYSGTNPPYFTQEAMRAIADCPLRHLVVDLPSVDREEDNGALPNHRTWWNVAPGSRSAEGARTDRTITELADVPPELPDGLCALSIQIPPMWTDAAPSRLLAFELLPT